MVAGIVGSFAAGGDQLLSGRVQFRPAASSIIGRALLVTGDGSGIDAEQGSNA